MAAASRARALLVAFLAAVGLAGHLPTAEAGHDAVPDVIALQADYVKRLIDAGEALVLVDLRKPGEYRSGHLPGAVSLPITELDRRFAEIPRSPRVVLYCECPIEDIATAFVFLRSKGYANHAILEGGFDGWLRRRYPVRR
jgi:rhodanese-related sulfurtransferase